MDIPVDIEHTFAYDDGPMVAVDAAAEDPEARRAVFAGLRTTLANQHRAASPGAFTLAEASVVASRLGDLDAALGGGFPRGTIATLEGLPGSGRSAVAARLLACATRVGGLAAAIETPEGPDGSFSPQALAAAGVDLERLVIVRAAGPKQVARAADILLRSAAFGVVVVPAVTLRATVWTRLASLTHRANALLVAVGIEASDELRYFASLRVRLHPSHVRFAGESGPFCALAGTRIEATVLKHKRAVPGKRAAFACASFETGAPYAAVRERVLGPVARRIDVTA